MEVDMDQKQFEDEFQQKWTACKTWCSVKWNALREWAKDVPGWLRARWLEARPHVAHFCTKTGEKCVAFKEWCKKKWPTVAVMLKNMKEGLLVDWGKLKQFFKEVWPKTKANYEHEKNNWYGMLMLMGMAFYIPYLGGRLLVLAAIAKWHELQEQRKAQLVK